MTRRQPRRGAMVTAQGMLMTLLLVATPGRGAHAGQEAPSPDAPAPADAESPAPAPPADDVQIELPPPPPSTEPPPAPPVAVPAPPAPAPAPTPPPLRVNVTAKFSAELYGFVEFDSILDSTQALNETPGNGALSKAGSFADGHSRLTF